ncbi:programmed cell death 1 ligand 1-like isoform X2 [Syngnathoides biaculeatus]|nr:programmed cell death 1 ligand 1-like isoform X2 [Syngnathoides biaculeatus]XP_061656420.1 programmed cell death 1 ligand 1-like isoform X2 [Syngnathoides biaculeatus]
MDHGQEQASLQNPDFRGRARLLTEQIRDGWAKLQVSGLRINDSGIYQCIVWTKNGADFKNINLFVSAPFKTVTKNISISARGDELTLSCRSEGYPMSTVTWGDPHRRELNASTAVVSTGDGLFKITTRIRVASRQESNYTCSFDSSGSSATFLIPDDIQLQEEIKYNVVVIGAAVGVITCIAIALFAFIVVHKKGLCRKIRNIPMTQEEEEKINVFPEVHRRGSFSTTTAKSSEDQHLYLF